MPQHHALAAPAAAHVLKTAACLWLLCLSHVQGWDAAQRFCLRVLDACVGWEQLERQKDFKGRLW